MCSSDLSEYFQEKHDLEGDIKNVVEAITALRQALEKPADEWVGLTDEERKQLWRDVIKWGDPSHDDVDLMKAIEAKLKEKNT